MSLPRSRPGLQRWSGPELGDARYEVDADDGGWWVIGWDQPPTVMYAIRVEDDAAGAQRVISVRTALIGDDPAVGELDGHLGLALPDGVADALGADIDRLTPQLHTAHRAAGSRQPLQISCLRGPLTCTCSARSEGLEPPTF